LQTTQKKYCPASFFLDCPFAHPRCVWRCPGTFWSCPLIYGVKVGGGQFVFMLQTCAYLEHAFG